MLRVFDASAERPSLAGIRENGQKRQQRGGQPPGTPSDFDEDYFSRRARVVRQNRLALPLREAGKERGIVPWVGSAGRSKITRKDEDPIVTHPAGNTYTKADRET